MKERTFTENGEFTFEFQDKAGNKSTLTATVDWLENGVIFKSDVYKIEPKYVSRIKPKTTVSNFKVNVTTIPNTQLTFLDRDGKITTADLTLLRGILYEGKTL